jgi:predicted nucleotidyltransferase
MPKENTLLVFPADTCCDIEQSGALRKARCETEVDLIAVEMLERDPVLAEIVRRLVEAYRPECIYLFGSKARGDAGPDSDYDVLLIVPDDAPPARRTSRLAYEALWGTGAAADVLVWPRKRFDSRLHLKASLPATVQREGKLLHAA